MRATLTLCADDYGLSPGVGRAIRALISQGRLQATGCMTAMPHWPAEADLLKPLEGRADFGVHLMLTEQRPLGTMPGLAPGGKLPGVTQLIKRAHARRLDRAEIAAELERQVDAFEAAMGRPPDFLDGHHHVHLLPVVRDVVLDLWRRRLKPRDGWVRSCWDNPVSIWRRGIDPVRATMIALLGLRLHRMLTAEGARHNRCFRGVYDFSGRVPYGALFARFLESPCGNMLVMCHPGEVDEDLRAVEWLTEQRAVEHAFLASDAFDACLAARGLVTARP